MLRILGAVIGVIIIAAIVMVGLSIWRRMAPQTLGASATATPVPVSGKTTPTPSPINRHKLDRSILYELTPVGSAGQFGTVKLTQIGDTVEITVDANGYLKNRSYDAEVVSGPCGAVGSVMYELNALTRGQSKTAVNTTLYSLQSASPFSVNVYEIDNSVRTPVLCGNITL